MNDGFESYDSKMHHEKMARLYRIHGDDIFEIVDRMYDRGMNPEDIDKVAGKIQAELDTERGYLKDEILPGMGGGGSLADVLVQTALMNVGSLGRWAWRKLTA